MGRSKQLRAHTQKCLEDRLAKESRWGNSLRAGGAVSRVWSYYRQDPLVLPDMLLVRPESKPKLWASFSDYLPSTRNVPEIVLGSGIKT